MKRTRITSLIATLGLLLACSLTTRGTSLLLDFGPTAVTTAYATNSPAHAIQAVPATEITWNQIVSDTNTLYYSDGSAATGVTLDLGRSADGVDTIDFNDNGFSVSALGWSISTGVYAGTSPVKDGIFGGSTTANQALGLRVDGLPAGTYTLYFHGRNTSAAYAPERFYAANQAGATTFSFSPANLNTTLSSSSPAITNGFVPGDNFGTLHRYPGGWRIIVPGVRGTGCARVSRIHEHRGDLFRGPGSGDQDHRATREPDHP